MKLNITEKSTYNYNLPEELIAQSPLEKRDFSRMLCYNKKTKEITHKHFYDILTYLKKGDVLVLNNTKVIPARLFGRKIDTGARIEIFLIKRINLTDWEVISRPFKRLKEGTIIKFSDELSCKVLKKEQEGVCKVRFIYAGVFENLLQKLGEVPLPPYIKQKLNNSERYQTVYSKVEGSNAAPTAGLHFTPELLEKIKQTGVEIVEVILHVGLGTFRPVKEENILNHKMHSEFFSLDEKNADIINKAKQDGRRIIAVGTTSVRVLESCAESGKVKHKSGQTEIFIYPGYKFQIVDALITNFHLPESTLLMLVCAFCGINETLSFYNEAIREKYRFFSFGDCCFIYEEVEKAF